MRSKTPPRRERPGDRLAKIAILLLGGLLFIVSIVAAYEELQAYAVRSADTGELLARVANMPKGAGSTNIPRSASAGHILIRSCLQALSRAQWAGAKPAMLEETSRGCLDIAKREAARRPLDANAWFVAATLAWRLGESDAAESFLDTSYRTGPNEGWIASRRSWFTHAIEEDLPDRFRTLADQDFLLMFRSEQGAEALAARYVEDPAIRGRLTALAAKAPMERQGRFLHFIREAMKNSR